MSIACILWLAALITAILSGATGRVPLWVAVVLGTLAGLVTCLPLR